MSFHLVSTKSAKIHFYYTFCFIITVVYFSNIVYNISNAEEDLDDEEGQLFDLESNTPNDESSLYVFDNSDDEPFRCTFTMDPKCCKAVTEAFVRLHEDGTIYRR